MSMISRIEKLLFGYTAEEAVEIRGRLMEQRIERALAREFTALDEADDDDGDDADQGAQPVYQHDDSEVAG